VDAIHTGALRDDPTRQDHVFGLAIPQSCPGVPDELLGPRNTWADKAAYDGTCRKLAALFADNFQQYQDVAGKSVSEAGPRLEAA
jgi:phosphoenolpyruvate carboxykinase (ATP)